MMLDCSGSRTDSSELCEETLDKIGEILEQRKKCVKQIMSKTVEGLKNAYDVRLPTSPADLIFDLFKVPNKDYASITKLIKVLKSFGLREKDPRLKEMMTRIRTIEDLRQSDHNSGFHLRRHAFKECITPAILLISQVLRSQMIIPSWEEFCGRIKEIFEECRCDSSGSVSTYIPQLTRQDPNLWGLSICTIDGQRVSFGDYKSNFCIQSVSKAFNYSIVASDLGAETVHSYVGHEPSGRLFNEICLDGNGKPHNPMINSGAIIVTSLIKKGMTMSDRFDFVLQEYRKLAGGEHVGFDNATFLSERDAADRNYALSYYMKENDCFPTGTKSLREELDLYFQLCSLETNCDTLSVMAATLANGGVCPLTNERCVSPQPCRDVLSLMYSCGMYDLSGKFAFQVGLPAKSGISGVMIVVVPNLMGIALFSPPLDRTGNPHRGVVFCKKLIEKFSFHNYDSLLHADSLKLDPRRRVGNRDTELVVSLLFASKNNDTETIRRMYLQGTNLEVADYDGRTALHIAASEGHESLVRFFLFVAKVNHNAKDRWGRTPLDDARLFNNASVVQLLESHRPRKTSFHNCELDQISEDSSSETANSTYSSSESESDFPLDDDTEAAGLEGNQRTEQAEPASSDIRHKRLHHERTRRSSDFQSKYVLGHRSRPGSYLSD
ncbi:hypothetical protein Q1695_011470 [Nippostrongylus brasiliensis]|nr:hypothetical protein Q1695_011470 [Nippostrongylus brasiliensis]